MADKRNIPIFYACDEGFIKYAAVSLHSMIVNASPDYHYSVYVLHTGISAETQQKMLRLSNDRFDVIFSDVSERLHAITDVLPVRDYYSNTTYFRMFIAEMFPEYDKVIYIDGDTIVQGDISELYFTELGESWIGACHEQAMVQTDHYGAYAEKVVGVSRHNFFNAGLLLINAKMFREKEILRRFADRRSARIISSGSTSAGTPKPTAISPIRSKKPRSSTISWSASRGTTPTAQAAISSGAMPPRPMFTTRSKRCSITSPKKIN